MYPIIGRRVQMVHVFSKILPIIIIIIERATLNLSFRYLRILIVKTVIDQFFKLQMFSISKHLVAISPDIGQESQPIQPRLVLAGCCVLGKQLHSPILCHPYITCITCI